MDKPQLTIDQLKNYLGTGLKINPIHIPIQHQYSTRHELDLSVMYNCKLDQIKPICFRLSDLDKFIPELGFVPIDQMKILSLGSLPRSLDFKWMYFHQINQLFQWHFWPFGDEYFEQGLIIDKLTHGKEVSNG